MRGHCELDVLVRGEVYWRNSGGVSEHVCIMPGRTPGMYRVQRTTRYLALVAYFRIQGLCSLTFCSVGDAFLEELKLHKNTITTTDMLLRRTRYGIRTAVEEQQQQHSVPLLCALRV